MKEDILVWTFLIIIFVAGIGLFTSFHSPTNGQHTGYVTAVEKGGLIFQTWSVYLKTDPQSSQEDRYCVVDPTVVSQLQNAEGADSQITVLYNNSYFMPPWNCVGADESIIASVCDPTEPPGFTPYNSQTGGFTGLPGCLLPVVGQSQTTVDQDGSQENPSSYEGTVVQSGGITSQSITTTAAAYGTGENLTPGGNYVLTSFDGPGDLTQMGGEPNWVGSSYEMLIGCKKGYIITKAQSPTNSPLDTYLIGVPDMTIGVELLNQSSNTVVITCEEQS